MRTSALKHFAAPLALAAAMASPYAFAAAANPTLFTADLTGLEEVPSVSSPGSGLFIASIRPGETQIDYTLGYSGLQGAATQAHIHFGQRGVAGGISIWLCGAQTQTGVGPATCPASGVVQGTIGAGAVVGPTGQLIAAGELSEIIAAMRAGRAYVNVHTDQVGSGEIRGQINSHSGF